MLFPASAGAAEKGIETDLTWAISGADGDRTVRDVQELGAKWMRLTMAWHDIETANGSYSRLSHYDGAIRKAASAGTRIVVTVYTAPNWASGVGDRESPPLDPADYADFLRFAAARWGGYVDAWEIWNEPNLRDFWSTGPSGSRYAQLLKAAYPAVKAADPTAAVLFGGVAYNDYHFIEAAYAAVPNLGDYYDVMATHPYPRPADIPPERVWLGSDGRIATKAFAAYREVRKVMLGHGDDKPLWFTEFGWSTNTIDGWGVTEAQQADYLTRALQCVEQDPYVHVAIWYMHRNHSWAGDANTWEDQLGLVRTDFSRKLAFDAFRRYAPGAGGCNYDMPESAPPAPSSPLSESAPADPPLTPLGPLRPPSLEQSSPRLTVRRARIAEGALLLDGRVARDATGTVRVVAVYGGVTHDFKTPVQGGVITVRRRLPDGALAQGAWVAVDYPATGRFQRQWVVLLAGARGPRLRLQHERDAASASRSGTITGTLVSDARGSVTVALSYRDAQGKPHTSLTRSKVRRGGFRRAVRVPDAARKAILTVVYSGDAARGIGGGSATLRVP